MDQVPFLVPNSSTGKLASKIHFRQRHSMRRSSLRTLICESKASACAISGSPSMNALTVCFPTYFTIPEELCGLTRFGSYRNPAQRVPNQEGQLYLYPCCSSLELLEDSAPKKDTKDPAKPFATINYSCPSCTACATSQATFRIHIVVIGCHALQSFTTTCVYLLDSTESNSGPPSAARHIHDR
jgi:hypothetical protein